MTDTPPKQTGQTGDCAQTDYDIEHLVDAILAALDFEDTP